MSKKAAIVRGMRKAAHLSRRTLSKGANLSGRIEQKADRIINGTDPTIQIHDTVLFEKLYYEANYEIVPLHPALPRSGRQQKVTLMIPSLQKSSFFGGTATALIFAAEICRSKNVSLRIVETLRHGNAKAEQLSEFFINAGTPIATDNIELIDVSARTFNRYGYLDLHPDDIFIASAWWDAQLLIDMPLQKPFIYLIQDYEPIFYNNSDKYILAESTYHSDRFIPVCNTQLMYNFMVSKGYYQIQEKGVWFEPAVGLKTKKQSVDKKAKKTMFIYGRPSVARNLFYFTLDCLNELFLNQDLQSEDWELYMAGQDNVTDVVLASGVKIVNLGKMDLDKYYRFVGSVDVAISPMMAPHPNYPTLEFASAGSAVVTTKFETKQNLQNYSKNIFIADIEKESFKKAIVDAAKTTREMRLKNATHNKIPNDWQSTLKETIKTVSREF